MKYNFWVNHNGVYYAPGTEVLGGKAPSEKVVEQPTEKVESKTPSYTRSQIQQLNKASATEVAKELGVEIDEDMTGNEIKGKILAKLGI